MIGLNGIDNGHVLTITDHVSQGWLTVAWQVAVGALGLAMFIVGYMDSTGKVIAQREPQKQTQHAQHAQQYVQQAQRNEEHLSKTL